MEHESSWDILPNDIIVVVLAYLPSKQIAKLATISKQLYTCTSDNALWKRKFLADYDQRVAKKLAGRAGEAEQAFLELLQPDHPEHYVLTDWKSGYVMKVINNTTSERLQCFSNCLANIAQGFPMLNSHELTRYLFMPRLNEPVLPLKIERIFSRREERGSKVQPIEQYADSRGTQLFRKIVAESTPAQLSLKYLLVNGGKHMELLSHLQRSNAPSICLLGKWFNQTNSRNFPFLVKFDADLALTEWLFTHCYKRSAIAVMTITPTVADHAAKLWYLQPFDASTALLVYLRHHLAHWFCLVERGFCWIYDAVTLYTVCRVLPAPLIDKLFYDIARNHEGLELKRVPVVDSYLVFGDEFHVGELPQEMLLLERDHYLTQSTGTLKTDEERINALMAYMKHRELYLFGANNFGAKLQAMTTQEERHAYQNHVIDMCGKYGATPYAKEFYQLVGEHGEFWNVAECQEELNNATMTKALLSRLHAILMERKDVTPMDTL